MKLAIAIPALNEEASIGAVIEAAIAAQAEITRASPVEQVDIIVVSDGSTDRTAEIAGGFGAAVKLVVFPTNRGYGAAIQEAWRQSDADLLGFMDADGTCDPSFFAPLCRTVCDTGADIVLGCRMTPSSEMPLVRRVGNTAFAWLLTALSSRRVRDTASGMRVVRRSALPRLSPLPDGLHFTPAMTARALLGGGIRLVEIDMPYRERAGRSKLQPTRDGWRFLKAIFDAAFLYRPYVPFAALGALCAVVATALMVRPILHYAAHRSVLEWMIYRFIVSDLLGISAALLFAAAYLTRKMVRISLQDSRSQSRMERRFAGPAPLLIGVVLVLAGGALVVPSLVELVRTGATYEHWSRFVTMSFLVSVALVLVVARAIDHVLNLLAARLEYLRRSAAPSGPSDPPRRDPSE